MQKSIGVHKVKQTFLDYSPLRARLGFFSSSSSPFCEKKKKKQNILSRNGLCVLVYHLHTHLKKDNFHCTQFQWEKKIKFIHLHTKYSMESISKCFLTCAIQFVSFSVVSTRWKSKEIIKEEKKNNNVSILLSQLRVLRICLSRPKTWYNIYTPQNTVKDTDCYW